MNVLRMVKLFGWERRMDARVRAKRADELRLILKRKLVELASNNINYVLPLAHMIACYTTFVVVMKKPLSASIVFSTMSIFTVLREQLWMVLSLIPMLIRGSSFFFLCWVSFVARLIARIAKVSLDRVNEFLHDSELLDAFASPESDRDTALAAAAAAADADDNGWFLGFQDAYFSWTSSPSSGTLTPGMSRRAFKLRIDGDLSFRRGGLNLIVGPTGSGKTSLLMALLGEMHFEPASLGSRFGLPRAGGVAYAAQESWVQNESIRENILFGAAYDEDRYKKGKSLFSLLD
jgi:ABC-type multidrug transport system fused ATPase/permease subunit